MKSIEELKQIAMSRQDGHKGSIDLYARRLNDKDPYREVIIGLLGECAFGDRYGLEADLKFRPKGDNHIDFKVWVDGKKLVTIDVKTYRNPTKLLIKEWEIKKCSDLLVMAHYVDDTNIQFLGWTTKKVMQEQPTEITSQRLQIRNYFLWKDNLQDMKVIDDVFDKYWVSQVIED